MSRSGFAVGSFVILLCLLAGTARAENKTSVSIYGGILTTEDSSDLWFGPTRFGDQQLLAVSLTREFINIGELTGLGWLKPLKLEGEGIVDLHWGSWPKQQEFVEFIGAFNLRWHHFPWNKWVVTTMGIGDGVSYTTAIPAYEEKINDKSTSYLNYLMFDVTFAHPSLPQLALLLRWHHRSAIFGLIDNMHGGSDFFTAGLKYTF